ncbi:CoA-transferase family III domain-containing protein [Lipomyces starkeyi]
MPLADSWSIVLRKHLAEILRTQTTSKTFHSLVSDPAIPIADAVRAKSSFVKFTLPDMNADSLEGAVASTLAEVRYHDDDDAVKNDAVTVDLQHATMFLFMAYLASVDGLTELDPAATTTLNMIGLPGHIPGFTDYEEIIKTIQDAVIKFTAAELEMMNAEKGQAGSEILEHETPPVPSSPSPSADPTKRQVLDGIKVLELCRIIAAPVLKITGPGLSDVPFFQVDGNMGKRTTELDMKSAKGVVHFEKLVEEADVIKRGRGFVYVSENCFGLKGNWALRPGWQQIADCVSGVAWTHGISMGRDDPVIPPFPMSDYDTGCIGAIAALSSLYKRATEGGSYWASTSLVQYGLLLMKQGTYPDWLKRIRDMHDPSIKTLTSIAALTQTTSLVQFWRH